MTQGNVPSIPEEVAAEERTVRLFLTYLKQPATLAALTALAKKMDMFEELTNYAETLKWVQDVGELLKVAPTFHAVALLAREASPSVLPHTALPTVGCIEAALVAYHTWVEAQVGD